MPRAPASARRARSWLGLGGAVLIWGSEAAAQVPLEALGGFFDGPRQRLRRSGWIARAPLARSGAFPRGVLELPIGAGHAVLRAPERALAEWRGAGLRWSPPRHLLMDRARAAIRLDAARAAGAGSGAGVVIGVVDSGIDASHADLRRADGSTRLAWWLDFASAPAGAQPELEAALGCSAAVGLRCQVLAAADIDARLSDDIAGNEPRDAVGHGTIVASIAAGNGAWGGGSAFAGVAPEATLIGARVTGAGGAISDADVLLATQFIFERARELGAPAVVNLSLGSDFGAHDGASELSRALAELVGPAWPGRAIVVAGGNSGQLHPAAGAGPAEWFGVHAERAASAEAPGLARLATPYPLHGLATTDASLFVWIELHPPEALSVGVRLPDGRRIEPVGIDQSHVEEAGELQVAVVHGLGDGSGREEVRRDWADAPLAEVLPSTGAAVVLIDGRWPAGAEFEIEIAGEGRAELWVQSEGDLGPAGGTLGALFEGASARSTVTIPAAHPGLIAVGASVERLEWTDYTGARFSVAALPVTPAPALGSAAFFSSAGPSSGGAFKPDLLAPGAFVISAMARSADPRTGAAGIFSGGFCPGLGCQVVSDGYALTAGTSMAAPMVSGAAALLLEREPALTQPELRAWLVAGAGALAVAPDVASREGSGTLDIERSLLAADAAPRGPSERPSAAQSRLRVAADRVLADAARPLSALVWLADARGEPFDAAPERIGLTVRGGVLRSELGRVAPGLYEFALSAAPPGPAQLSIEVFVDAEPLLALALPIEGGEATRRSGDSGGCDLSVAARAGERTPGALAALALAAACGARRWRARRALRARSGRS